MKSLMILFIVLSVSILAFGQNCKYDKNGFKEVPWGHIQSQLELGEFREVKGKTIVGNELISGVRIALYELTENGSRFVGSQVSDVKGNFCFKKLSNGKYELRMGMEGLNSRYFAITLNRKNKKLRNRIQAEMEVGT